MVDKKTVDRVRDWYQKGYNAREIAQVAKLPERLIEAIIYKPTTAEEWNRKIFSNHR